MVLAGTVSIAEKYAELCATPSDIFEHLPTFVDLVIEREAQHVVELGTRTGVSTIAWLHGLNQTGGVLTSVDIDGQPPIGDHAHWTFMQGDDLSPQVYCHLRPADIVFIDTSHHYLQTVRELNLYVHLVRRPGLIVLHDTELPHPEGAPHGDPVFPVKTAVEEFCAENGYRWSNRPNCWGLGIIEVD